ncbi:Uncharacterised protein [Mycobacterium tuberculosis]|nr:Uncharacterised protein [Mycobacterium tuberculosis]
MLTHHHTPRGATVKETNSIVATTASPGRTSTAKAPARICQGAKLFCDDSAMTSVA